ncbi:hypothetical protein [Chlorogloea sp. CCALA 695]|uniref:hypothetical protein n=1 Tax=Chlorogloea sp. CCALA 695 TaxID=2107693 RepID=UPI000D04D203|nr:hypothetical protein [Chlorogloea sp. CCALA 695]PSB29667.1 hypothetical protein C7B70_17780 [Chlorogloea sp. CCALA 695]
MIDDTQTRLSNKAANPLLLDILSDRELNEVIQKSSSSGKVEIEIKVSQNGRQSLLVNVRKFEVCPCDPPQHEDGCVHRVGDDGNPIC